MKAILENNKTFRVTEVRGSYVYAESNGKTKVFRADLVNIIEVDDIPVKPKFINKKKICEKLSVTASSPALSRQERERVLADIERRKYESISW